MVPMFGTQSVNINTIYEERLTTTIKTTDHDMTLHHFDLRGRVRVQLLTYVDMSERKVSIDVSTE